MGNRARTALAILVLSSAVYCSPNDGENNVGEDAGANDVQEFQDVDSEGNGGVEQADMDDSDAGGEPGTTCAETVTTSLDLGRCTVDATTTAYALIRNCRENAVTVSEITACVDDEEGNCTARPEVLAVDDRRLPDELSNGGFELEPGGSLPVSVVFSPTNTNQVRGELHVLYGPGEDSDVIPVTGTGMENACPVAVAEGKLSSINKWRESIRAQLDDTVDLRATNSVDADGSVEQFHWRLLQRPPTSETTPEPADAVESSMRIDATGNYVAALTVIDERGVRSCAPDIVEIDASGNHDIRVELTWDTPADPDQTDETGTDLDLHFLHENGTWNELPFDIFWNNPTNEWGAPGADDNPVLTSGDDDDGAGPERVELNGPEMAIHYGVGVYYNSDEPEFGNTEATIRVFIRGEMKYELSVDLTVGEFWNVATIFWGETANINVINQVTDGFP